MSTRAAVRTEGLTRRFGNAVAVDGLDLEVPEGTIFGLLGPNGAGKSTTLKMLITLLAPSGGRAEVAGYDVVGQAPQVRAVMGYVPQLLSADSALTGLENLLVSSRIYRVPRRLRKERIDEAVTLAGLGGAAHRLVREYSGGMVRRLEVAQSLLHRPAVLFLDEPTVGLDPVARRAVWDQLHRLGQDHGTTVVLTTHYMEEAEELCHRVGIMHLGRLAGVGSPQELRSSVSGASTLEDVFTTLAGETVVDGEGFRDAMRVRRAQRARG